MPSQGSFQGGPMLSNACTAAAKPLGNSSGSPPPASNAPHSAVLASCGRSAPARTAIAVCISHQTMFPKSVFGRKSFVSLRPLASTMSGPDERSTVSNKTRAGNPMISSGGTLSTKSSESTPVSRASFPTRFISRAKLSHASVTEDVGTHSWRARDSAVISHPCSSPMVTAGRHATARHSGERSLRSPTAIWPNSSQDCCSRSKRMVMQAFVRRSEAQRTW
mmetsp:Transcript_78397/g.204369  ORF Transcript_78397/g.204369 Transcript_78397/m.204369 type:complete len:221 (+) Transcript_78397:141-803(+)